MPVPESDMICRFIRNSKSYWSMTENRPKAKAFLENSLSLWHLDRLLEHNVSVADLRLGELADSGQAHHTAGDYLQFAREVEKQTGEPFEVEVEWRPEDEYVAESWRQWRYAHVQVEIAKGPPKFPPLFRRLLAIHARNTTPPDNFIDQNNQEQS